MPKYLVNRQVKRVGVASSTGVRDGLSALRFERFEVEQVRRIQPPSIPFSSEEIASDIGGRSARGGLSNCV
ncbi:MAG: hypothetical protein ACXU90_12240 [Gemmatimonadaceae bacterium]